MIAVSLPVDGFAEPHTTAQHWFECSRVPISLVGMHSTSCHALYISRCKIYTAELMQSLYSIVENAYVPFACSKWGVLIGTVISHVACIVICVRSHGINKIVCST